MHKTLPILFAFSALSLLTNAQNDCNFAGTAEAGQFIGQSTQHQLDAIVLCFGDSVLIQHQGNAVLSGDPDPGTPPGVYFTAYVCYPGVSGPTLADVLADPCLLPGSATGVYATPGVENGGETWFYNTGAIQNNFNQGQPMLLYFAPATVDDYQLSSYESPQPGAPPGPCVNINLDEAFSVLFLNKITATGISTNFTDDCLGKFTVRGGYPEYDPSATYSIDISLASDPSVKAVFASQEGFFFHLSNILFSVPQAGVYNVTVDDGIGCGYQFQMKMSDCDPSDNLKYDIGEAAGAVGETVCLPIQVENFDILDASFSLNWDSTLLKFKGIQAFHPAIAPFFNADTLTYLDGEGRLGILVFDNLNFDPIHIPDGENLFEVCFEVLDTSSENCIPVWVSNGPSGVVGHNTTGHILAVSVLPGGVCKVLGLAEHSESEGWKVFPNPVGTGESALIQMPGIKGTTGQIELLDARGALVFSKNIHPGNSENQVRLSLEGVPPGMYFIRSKGAARAFKLLVH